MVRAQILPMDSGLHAQSGPAATQCVPGWPDHLPAVTSVTPSVSAGT